MPIKIIADVMFEQRVDPALVGSIDESRAATEDGLAVNHDYFDMREYGLTDLREALEFEHEAFAQLEAADYSDEAIEEVDEEWAESCITPGIDFGVASSALALVAMGCIPITSCRGKCLDEDHRHEAPCISFYPARASVDSLVRFAKSANVCIVNNEDMLEIYSADLRLMHRFAVDVSQALNAHTEI